MPRNRKRDSIAKITRSVQCVHKKLHFLGWVGHGVGFLLILVFIHEYCVELVGLVSYTQVQFAGRILGLQLLISKVLKTHCKLVFLSLL